MTQKWVRISHDIRAIGVWAIEVRLYSQTVFWRGSELMWKFTWQFKLSCFLNLTLCTQAAKLSTDIFKSTEIENYVECFTLSQKASNHYIKKTKNKSYHLYKNIELCRRMSSFFFFFFFFFHLEQLLCAAVQKYNLINTELSACVRACVRACLLACACMFPETAGQLKPNFTRSFQGIRLYK